MRAKYLTAVTIGIWLWLIANVLASKSLVLVSGANVLEPVGVVSISGQCIVEGTASLTFPYVVPAFTFKSANGRQVVDIPQVTPGQPVTVQKSGNAVTTCVWSSVSASVPTPTPTPTVTPTPLPPTGPISFIYLGSFYEPNGPAINNGLMAVRVVNGQLRFFDQIGNCGNLIEYAAPATLGTTLQNAPTATLVKNWGNVTQGRLITAQGQPMPNLLCTQLYWDSQANGLWWVYFNNYNVTGAVDPSLGFTSLDDAAGTFTSYGPWMFNSTTHTTNRYLQKIGPTFYVGSIGTESGNASSSWGPSLSSVPALDPRTTAPNAPTAFGLIRLINYPISNKAPRPSDWVSHGNPDTSGMDRWDQCSGYYGTGTIIEGYFAFLGPQSTGHCWYSTYLDPLHAGIQDVEGIQTTGPHVGSPQRVMVYLYTTPSQTWDAAIDLSISGGLYSAYKRVNGSYYDATAKRLYVSVKQMGPAYDYRPIINVYQVQ